jgi:trigger factor
MQVSVEKISDIERRLTIVVPADQVKAAYTKEINEVASKANIKGFRPGKAPFPVIQQRFGESARKDALNSVMQKALYEAIAETKLHPISMPQVMPKMMLADQPLEFTVSFEVLPEVGNIQFAMTNIDKPVVEVLDSDLENVLEQLRKQHTKWHVVEREAHEQDRIVIDYYAIFDGKSDVDSKIQNFPLELGSKGMLPGFEEGLLGAKAGEERTLNLSFPTDFSADDKAGKPIVFVVQVKQVFEAETPVLDEKFAKQLGVKNGNVEELKKQIKQSLEQERNRLVKEKLKEQIFGQLLEQNPLDVPKSLVEREAKKIHDEVYPQHQPHDHHQHSEKENAAFNDIAKKRVVLGLLVSEYGKQANLVADQAHIDKRIQEIASAYENPQEVIEWLSSNERRSGVEAQVAEDLVLDKLMEGVPITEKIMSYAELKGIRI